MTTAVSDPIMQTELPVRMTPRLGRFAQLGAVVIAVLASMSVGGRPPAFDPGPTTQVGFTFTPWAARYAGLDPDTALDILLDRLEPDLVRLPVYWSDVAPARGQFDFSTVDAMLDRVQAYDAQASRPARVVLVVVEPESPPSMGGASRACDALDAEAAAGETLTRIGLSVFGGGVTLMVVSGARSV